MCGLIAWCRADNQIDRGKLHSATEILAHRGPDDSGTYIDENLGLGHRRLSILDLSERGHQPLRDPASRRIIIYNGEIYNFKSLRSELKKSGFEFRTETDTEVLLKGWNHWREDLFQRLNGMYSLVIYHPREKRIYAARDPFGIKPLYLYQGTAGFTLASEQKAILELADESPELDPEGLNEYLTFQNFLSNRTLLKNIRTLEPGQLYKFSTDQPQKSPATSKFFDFTYTGDYNGNRKQAVEELEFRLRQAVENHMVSDVPVHSYLSGGLDTSTICALAAEESPHRLKTITVGFDTSGVEGREAGYDERNSARVVAEQIGSNHYEAVVTADTLQQVIDNLVYHMEEPRVGQSYPNYVAARLAASHGKAVLSGTGGDELFGGYPWRYQVAWRDNNESANRDGLFDFWQRLLGPEEQKELLPPELCAKIDFERPRRLFSNWLQDLPYDLSAEREYLNACLHIETSFFLRGLLHVEDRLGMAFGLEARFPFLDRDLFELAQEIPANWKISPFHKEQEPGEYIRSDNGKLILREAMERILPETISRRDKQGFSGPYKHWQNNQQQEFITQKLHKSTLTKAASPRRGTNRLTDWSLLYLAEFESVFTDQ